MTLKYNFVVNCGHVEFTGTGSKKKEKRNAAKDLCEIKGCFDQITVNVIGGSSQYNLSSVIKKKN